MTLAVVKRMKDRAARVLIAEYLAGNIDVNQLQQKMKSLPENVVIK